MEQAIRVLSVLLKKNQLQKDIFGRKRAVNLTKENICLSVFPGQALPSNYGDGAEPLVIHREPTKGQSHGKQSQLCHCTESAGGGGKGGSGTLGE